MSPSQRAVLIKVRKEPVAQGVPISINVVRSLDETPGTLELTLFNLATETRKTLSTQRPAKSDDPRPAELVPIEIEVGYGDQTELLFSGAIRTITHERVGAQWRTCIQAGDGDYAYGTAFVNSTGQARPYEKVVQEVAKAMGVDLGNLDAQLSKKSFRRGLDQYQHGYAAMGLASREFSRLVRSLGFHWSIQDGKLQLLRRDECTSESVFQLNANSGLLETPGPGELETFICRSLMNAALRPGRKVHVRAGAEPQNVDAEIRINRVVHWGSTFSDAWYSDVEGSRL